MFKICGLNYMVNWTLLLQLFRLLRFISTTDLSSPSDVNFSYASSKQQTYEVAEVKAKVNYEKKITSNLKQNCKSFYSYLRNKRQVKSSVVSLDRGDGTSTDNSTESAEVLASAFSSVFEHEPSGPLPKTKNLGTDNNSIDDIHDMEVSSSDIKKQLLKLKIFQSFFFV